MYVTSDHLNAGQDHNIKIANKGKRPLGRPRLKWKDNIKMDIRETGWGTMDWIDLAQDMDQWRALANMVMHLQVP
jgi:hypothetical protein